MKDHPTTDSLAGEMAALQQEYPRWCITAVWTAVEASTDRRRLVAQCFGVTLAAWTTAGLREAIRAEETRRAEGRTP